MIITVVCDVLGEENNGTTVATNNLIRFIKAQGHEVRIICPDKDKMDWENYYITPTINLGKVINKYVAKAGVSLAKADKKILTSAISGSDIVHIMLPFNLGKTAVKIANELNIPTTAGFHMQAENFTSYIHMNKLQLLNKLVYKTIYNNVYKKVDRIHYPTQFIKDTFEKQIGKNTSGVVISNGVHDYVKKYYIEKPNELKDKYVILSTGRYAREKSQHTIIKAVKLSKYKDNIQLILAGCGVKEKEYKKLSKDLPVQPIFKLFDRKELVDVINYSDMYVHPAEIELEGIACLEAISCGKLTIVSDSTKSATRYFAVDKKCIFKNRNPKDLARVIDYFIEHPNESKKIANLYLQSENIQSQQDCLKQMEQMMLEVVNENKRKNHLL